MAANAEYQYYRTKNNKNIAFIVRYNVLQDGKHVKCNIRTWQEALAHAEKYTSSIFKEHKVEILNIWTGEIISYEEALKRAAQFVARH